MGTSCAPAFANLYLAVLESKVNLLLVYTRYIDDIFFVSETKDWEELRITDRLDPNLKVNWVASQNEIDYLDTVVYPVYTRTLVYRLYTKTRVKPTQTFQYLLWRSAHPPQSKLEWINAEILRRRMINSTETRLYESIMRFYMHLRWRGYPPRILNKWFKESLHPTSNNSTNKSTLSVIPFTTELNPIWDFVDFANTRAVFQFLH
ncbi:uncharacterized protein V1513DRAFT_38955 [Lipomyces chichibuensis]|uniref:uncharacterized protein n=1 Tax=Lipomyces chichibuensis TaxID=1546026 RepID=UPI00334365F4